MSHTDREYYAHLIIIGAVTFIALGFLHELGHMLAYNLMFPDMVGRGYSAWIELRGLGWYTLWWIPPDITAAHRFLIKIGGGVFAFICLLMRNIQKNPGYLVGAGAQSMYTVIEVVLL